MLDFQPRQYTAEQCLILCNLAAMVVKEMYLLRERNCRLKEVEGSQERDDISSPKLLSIMEVSCAFCRSGYQLHANTPHRYLHIF